MSQTYKDNNDKISIHNESFKKKKAKKSFPQTKTIKTPAEMTLDELRKSKGFRELGDMLYL